MVAALLLLSMAACRKDKDDITAPGTGSVDYTSATDQAMAADYDNDMMQQVDQAAMNNGVRSTDDACTPIS